jgi:predicted DNA-binding transcriptional regulator AlpA
MARPRKNPESDVPKRGEAAPVPPILVDRETTSRLVGLSPSNIASQVIKGTFPPPRKTSANRVCWLYSELTDWAKALPLSDILPPPPGTAGKIEDRDAA